jgi:hypothetical protein
MKQMFVGSGTRTKLSELCCKLELIPLLQRTLIQMDSSYQLISTEQMESLSITIHPAFLPQSTLTTPDRKACYACDSFHVLLQYIFVLTDL